MRIMIFSLLALAAFSCQSGPTDLHFGPGPDEESSARAYEECPECGERHG